MCHSPKPEALSLKPETLDPVYHFNSFAPRDSNIPELRNIPAIILVILLSFKVYSLISPQSPCRSLEGTLGIVLNQRILESLG